MLFEYLWRESESRKGCLTAQLVNNGMRILGYVYLKLFFVFARCLGSTLDYELLMTSAYDYTTARRDCEYTDLYSWLILVPIELKNNDYFTIHFILIETLIVPFIQINTFMRKKLHNISIRDYQYLIVD